MNRPSWKILMVDDDEDDYCLTRQMLSDAKHGEYILDWASTYAAGWDKIQTDAYDAVLMDYDLGDHNGLELIRNAVAADCKFPIILYTGRGSFEVDLQAMQAGAALYLTKSEANPLLLERSIRYAIERKRAEQALEHSRQEQARLASFPELNPNPILEIDLSGKIHYINPHGQTLFPDLMEKGTTHAFLAGWEEIVAQARNEPLIPWVREIQVQGHDYQQSIYFYERYQLIRIYGMDISIRMQALHALRESEAQQRELALSLAADRAKLAAVLANLPVGVWIADETGRMIDKNEQADRIWAGDAPLAESFAEYQQYAAWDAESGKTLLPEEFPMAIAQRTGQPAGPVEFNIRRFDGTAGTILVSAAPIKDPQGVVTGTVGINVDISELKLVNESLRLSEERFSKAFAATPNALVISRMADGQIELVNDAFEDLFGYSRAEVHGKTSLELNMFADPADREEALQRVRADQFLRNFEIDIRLKSGEIRRANLNVETLTIDHQSHILTVIEDITARKQAEAEVERYAQRLEQSNRELQDFAFVASHDLQEPLRKVQTFAGRLQHKAGAKLDSEESEYLERMGNAAERMASMLRGLLDYSRVTTKAQPFGSVDLAQVAAGVLQDLELQIEDSRGQVEVGELPVIEAEATQMHQLLLNLIGNALKFARPEVPPHIRVSSCLLEPTSAAQVETVEIRVEDNGIGFDPQFAGALFHPFHRLVGRSQFEGSGMGLAICRKIVERHGGTIAAHGQPGQGAVFIVQLPARQAA